MSNVDVPPEKDSSENEIDSPVDGPTPDWMKLATSSSSSPSLTEENTPDWLKDIKSGKSSSGEDSAKTDDDPYAGMSDLERLLAEEGVDLGEVAEDRPKGSEGMSARDWMISTSDDEMIRKKVGAQPIEEPLPVPEAVSIPEPEADDDPYAGMSDLERLLAEEGVDLGEVAEDRPKGSEGMSARDWMISTSDDEMIRKKVGAEPIEELSPQTEAEVEDIFETVEPEVSADDDDLPDWLRNAEEGLTQETPRPQFTSDVDDDDDLVDDDLPDWLQDVEEDSEETLEEIPEPITAAEDDKMVVQDDLPDWLREEDDEIEEAMQPVAIDAAEDDKMVVQGDLPDWLQNAETDADEGLSEPKPVSQDEDDEDALPDWLQDVEEEIEEMPESIAAIETEDDKMVVEDDLPDWLQEVEEDLQPEAVDAAEDDKMVVEDALPDWLQESDEDEDGGFDEPVSEQLVETATAIAAGGGDELSADDEDLPDWLKEVQEAEDEEVLPAPKLATEAVATDDDDDLFEDDFIDDDEDLPDWLQAVQEESNVETPAPSVVPEGTGQDAPLVSIAADDDLPDWLQDVQDEDEDETIVLAAVSPEPVAELGVDDKEEDDDLPDWLQDVQDEDEDETPVLADVVPEPVAEIGADAERDELPGWLQEVEEEGTGEDLFGVEDDSEFAEGAIVTDELPDWLTEVETEDEPFEPSEPSPQELEEVEAEDELPGWLQEVGEETEVTEIVEITEVIVEETPQPEEVSPIVETEIDEDSLPDWLQEPEQEPEQEPTEETLPGLEPVAVVEPDLEVEVDEPALVEEAVTEPEPQPVSVSVPTTGMPDWLKKLRQGGDTEEPVIAIASTPPVTPPPQPRPVAQVAAEPEPTPEIELPADPDERLKMAQAARNEGDIDSAIKVYDSLVSSGAHLDTIIDDMELTIKSHPSNYMLYQVMGDAMMKDGRLQSALEAYRNALDRLSD